MSYGRYNGGCLRTHAEVADILVARGERITRTGVLMAEQRALRKMAEHPLMRALWSEFYGREPETAC
jgi:hypothetical protein